ncbi:MAG: hypothetical protein GY814_15665 [Gammaproteobacteria bacterium]|nr:hypothetical protein [Gammaproteobacteria bacterium]
MNHGGAPLFSPSQVGIATAMGTPLAGLAVIVINYLRIGKRQNALSIFLLGSALLIALLVIKALAFSWVPGFIQFLIMITAMHFIAEKLQGGIFSCHLANGGIKSSLFSLLFWSLFVPTSLFLFVFGATYVLYV